jgi:hypothetical protein
MTTTTNGENPGYQLQCHACLNWTQHRVLAFYEEHWDSMDEGNEINGYDDHSVVQCGGCQRIAYAMRIWVHEAETDSFELVSVERAPSVPPLTKPHWAVRNDLDRNVPSRLFDLYNEVFSAIQIKAHNIAAMGVRAMLEFIMIDVVGDQGRFEANVEAFVTRGPVGPMLKEPLLKMLEVGSAVIHRGHKVKKHEVLAMMKILETIANLVYFHPKEVDTIDVPPPRIKPARSKSKPQSTSSDEAQPA